MMTETQKRFVAKTKETQTLMKLYATEGAISRKKMIFLEEKYSILITGIVDILVERWKED